MIIAEINKRFLFRKKQYDQQVITAVVFAFPLYYNHHLLQ